MNPIFNKNEVGDSDLPPTLDLILCDGMNSYRTILIGGCIEPTKSGLFAMVVKAGLDKVKADRTLEDIRGMHSDDIHTVNGFPPCGLHKIAGHNTMAIFGTLSMEFWH